MNNDPRRPKPNFRPNTGELINRFARSDSGVIVLKRRASLSLPLVRRTPYTYEEIEDEPEVERYSSVEKDDHSATQKGNSRVSEIRSYTNLSRHTLRQTIIANKKKRDDIFQAENVEESFSEPISIDSTQEKGSSQLQLINHYRRNVLQQANQSFILALAAAGIGLAFYISAVSLLLLRQPASISYTSLISGSLVELISAINFYLYGRTSRQLASFHTYLDRTCRFLTSDDSCEKIVDKDLKDKTRSQLILNFMEMSQTDFIDLKTENPNIKKEEA